MESEIEMVTPSASVSNLRPNRSPDSESRTSPILMRESLGIMTPNLEKTDRRVSVLALDNVSPMFFSFLKVLMYDLTPLTVLKFITAELILNEYWLDLLRRPIMLRG